MKIALINPGKNVRRSGFEGTAMPLGLGYLAAYVKRENHQVVVKDMQVEPNGLGEFLEQENPEVVGITIFTPLYLMTKTIIKFIRRKLPKIRLVAGGPHVSAVKSEVLKDIPELDIAVYGEGEETTLEILDGKKLENIKGICYRDNNKNVKVNKPRSFMKNLDKLPFPAWELFPLSKYKIHLPYGRTNRSMNMITSRGCPFNCAYCSKNFGNTYRKMSPKRILDEIRVLIKNYNIQEIHFYDDVFTMDKKRIEEICDRLIEEDIKIDWTCITRVDLVSYELLKKMKKAGCKLVGFGIENGNQQILNAVHKGYTINNIKNAFKWAKELKIKTGGTIMLGLPGETKETMQETIKLVREIAVDYPGFGITVIFPNTKIKRIFENRDARFYPLYKQKDNKYLFFAEENLTYNQLVIKLKKIRKMFYLNHKFIIKELLQVRGGYELSKLISTGIKIIREVV